MSSVKCRIYYRCIIIIYLIKPNKDENLLPSLIIIAASLLLIRIFICGSIDDTFKLKSENNAIKNKIRLSKEATSMTEMVNY
jgi:UDP-N-acetylmuramyl pentapeptide phosphotransferase/UDP-N-acetylglucosamine-1-phosphate transferase